MYIYVFIYIYIMFIYIYGKTIYYMIYLSINKKLLIFFGISA